MSLGYLRFPRQCLGNWWGRKTQVELAHGLEVVNREPPPKLPCQIFGQLVKQTFSVLGPPTPTLLLLHDPPPDLPIRLHQQGIDRANCLLAGLGQKTRDLLEILSPTSSTNGSCKITPCLVAFRQKALRRSARSLTNRAFKRAMASSAPVRFAASRHFHHFLTPRAKPTNPSSLPTLPNSKTGGSIALVRQAKHSPATVARGNLQYH